MKRTTLQVVLIAGAFVVSEANARAGPVVYTDREAFLAAAGDVHTIDFETLPDGSPSYFNAMITPEFNYTAQGVTFSSPVPVLRIGGNDVGGFHLDADSYPTGQRNWIIADLVVPATAVGIEFPGGTYLSLFDAQGEPLGTWLGGGSGAQFLLGVFGGDRAIARAVVDQGQSSQSIHAFFFTPVPEPAAAILVCLGGAILFGRRIRSRTLLSWFALTLPGTLPLYGEPPLVHSHSINLNFGTTNQINSWQQTLDSNPAVMPYIWVAASQRSTIIRIATADHVTADGRSVVTGQIVGEYWAAPTGCRLPPPGNQDSGPSRTTVDFDGSVWIANRNDLANGQCEGGPPCGHVVKIGNGFAFQWIDRNNNGVMDTSTGLGNFKDWPDDGDGICTPNDVNMAEDELIILYQPVPATGTRTVAVDRNNNVWVGGTGNRMHGLLNAWTGQLHDNDGVIGPALIN